MLAHPQGRIAISELTYGELARPSSAVAGGLLDAGVRTEELIGVSLPAGAEAIVAQLCIMRAGAADLPLDPANPPMRLAAIAEDARLRFTIGDPVAGLESIGGSTSGVPADRDHSQPRRAVAGGIARR
ncbi:MAG TPA: AMP-binding protein [Micromonosporaceae bacterium]